MSNHLNAIGHLDYAIAMMKAKTVAPPRADKIDIGTFHIRRLLSSGWTNASGGEFYVAVVITAN